MGQANLDNDQISTISQVQHKTAPSCIKQPQALRGANFKVCVMSLVDIERLIDRLTPAFLLALSLAVTVASVDLLIG